jgi:hypothetical protein
MSRRLAQRGKDAAEFVTTFSTFLVKAVPSGRRLLGYEKAKDAMSVMTQKRRGYKVEPLPMETSASHESLYSTVHGQREHDTFEERLCDNSMAPVPDQAAFRIDWPAWMRTRTPRDRRIIAGEVIGGAGKTRRGRFVIVQSVTYGCMGRNLFSFRRLRRDLVGSHVDTPVTRPTTKCGITTRRDVDRNRH